jgi:hypothetical protein
VNITDKESSLMINEGYLASSSINHGLTSLRKATLAQKGEYYLAFFQLSIGLERLMKLIIIQDFRAKDNTFPDNKYIRNFSHNLKQLFEKCESIGIEHNVISKADDISFKILLMLSNFSQTTRYYNLDFLTGRNTAINPLEEWAEIQIFLKNLYYGDRNIVPVQIRQLFESLDEISVTIVSNKYSDSISKASDFLLEVEEDRKLQGYAVYHIFLIIIFLVETLREIEYTKNIYPNLREFFGQYHDKYKLNEIVRKMKWSN